MQGSTNTFSNNRPGTDRFQDMIYNSILRLQLPQTTTPDYTNNSPFSASSTSRLGATNRILNPTYLPDPTGSGGLPPIGSPGFGPGGLTPPTVGPPPKPIPTGNGFNVAQFLAQYDPSRQLNVGTRPSFNVTPTGYHTGPGSTTPVHPPGTTDPVTGRNISGQPRTAVPAGTAEVGGIPGVLAMLGQLFPGNTAPPPGTAIAPLPRYDTAGATASSFNAPTIGILTRYEPDTPAGDAAYKKRSEAFNSQQTQYQSMIDSIMRSADADAGGGGRLVDPKANKIITPTISTEGTETQSADQIAQGVSGEDSLFTRNILPAYNSLFNTQNALTAAAAKESAGNLTGSGFANTMATALNRNNSSQQALLASTLNDLVSQEIARQGTGANLAATRNISQAGLDLSAQTTSAQLAQQAQALEQQARASGRADLMAAAQALQQRALAQAQLEQQAGLAEAERFTNTSMFNAGQENAANSQFFQAGVNRNQRQAEMDAARYASIFGGAQNQSQMNAQQLMQLLQQLFAGGQPVSNQTSGGFGSAIPGILQLIATLAA